MAVTQAQLDRLMDMAVNGILESGHGAKRVKFRSMAELMRAIEFAKGELGLTTGPSVSYASFNARTSTEGS